MIDKYGLYVLSDKYFAEFPYPAMMQNKYETRPYYLAIKNKSGVIWLVPLSSQTEKYRKAIERNESKHGAGGDIYHYIARVKGKDSAFLIGDAIPVSEKYIVRPFTVNGQPFAIQDKEDIKNIQSRLSKFLALVRQKKIKPAVDILKIEKTLLNK